MFRTSTKNLTPRAGRTGLFGGLPSCGSVPNIAYLDSGKDFEAVTPANVTPAFARAYLKGRRRLRAGAIKFPVVRNPEGDIVDCGHAYEWHEGVATAVLAGDLTCTVATFIKNDRHNPAVGETVVLLHPLSHW